ncbi:MAG: hypothetical protein AB1427_00915 [Thermodesulfobacteriota bacterium]
MILWQFTPAQCEPYLKFMGREVLFREAVIHLLVGETEAEKAKRLTDGYCKACRQTGRADCKKCDRNFKVITGRESR